MCVCVCVCNAKISEVYHYNITGFLASCEKASLNTGEIPHTPSLKGCRKTLQNKTNDVSNVRICSSRI